MSTTKVVTGKVRLSYANVWVPKAIGDSPEAKYSASLIIPKSDKKTIAKIEAAVKAAAELGKTSKFGGKIPTGPTFKLPLRDGDEERSDDPNYKNCYFLNASSKTAPNIVDLDRNEIMDKDEVYSGVYARVSLNFYPFAVNGNKGIAVGLNHIQKVADGDHLDGRTSADDDFSDDFEDDDLI